MPKFTLAAPPIQGTQVPDDWPGATEFADLGDLRKKLAVTSGDERVTVGYFVPEGRDGVIYAASSRPHVVGMGETEELALQDWVDELAAKWRLAQDLRPPFGAATENDIDALRKLLSVGYRGNSGTRN